MGIKVTYTIGDKMNLYKYPRTLHMPESPGATDDDKRFFTGSFNASFKNKNILITEKLDGENTSLYGNYSHARSLDSAHHSSRDWVKKFQAEIGHNIPENWRVCGENMFARHSISYDNLDSYFYGFSIWDENNNCLDTESTKEWFNLLGIQHVPIIDTLSSYDNNWQKDIYDIARQLVTEGKEGIVIRNTAQFHYYNFNSNVTKYVRSNHVQTDKHWMYDELICNTLKK